MNRRSNRTNRREGPANPYMDKNISELPSDDHISPRVNLRFNAEEGQIDKVDITTTGVETEIDSLTVSRALYERALAGDSDTIDILSNFFATQGQKEAFITWFTRQQAEQLSNLSTTVEATRLKEGIDEQPLTITTSGDVHHSPTTSTTPIVHPIQPDTTLTNARINITPINPDATPVHLLPVTPEDDVTMLTPIGGTDETDEETESVEANPEQPTDILDRINMSIPPKQTIEQVDFSTYENLIPITAGISLYQQQTDLINAAEAERAGGTFDIHDYLYANTANKGGSEIFSVFRYSFVPAVLQLMRDGHIIDLDSETIELPFGQLDSKAQNITLRGEYAELFWEAFNQQLEADGYQDNLNVHAMNKVGDFYRDYLTQLDAKGEQIDAVMAQGFDFTAVFRADSHTGQLKEGQYDFLLIPFAKMYKIDINRIGSDDARFIYKKQLTEKIFGGAQNVENALAEIKKQNEITKAHGPMGLLEQMGGPVWDYWTNLQGKLKDRPKLAAAAGIGLYLGAGVALRNIGRRLFKKDGNMRNWQRALGIGAGLFVANLAPLLLGNDQTGLEMIMSLMRNGDYEEQTEKARTREERRQITYTNLVTLMLQNETIGDLVKGDNAIFTVDRATNKITDIDMPKLANLLRKTNKDEIPAEYELYEGLLTHFDDDTERLSTFMMNSLNRLEIDYSNPEQYFYLARNRDVEQTYESSALDSWFSRVMGRFDKHVTSDPSFEDAQYDDDRKRELGSRWGRSPVVYYYVSEQTDIALEDGRHYSLQPGDRIARTMWREKEEPYRFFVSFVEDPAGNNRVAGFVDPAALTRIDSQATGARAFGGDTFAPADSDQLLDIFDYATKEPLALADRELMSNSASVFVRLGSTDDDAYDIVQIATGGGVNKRIVLIPRSYISTINDDDSTSPLRERSTRRQFNVVTGANVDGTNRLQDGTRATGEFIGSNSNKLRRKVRGINIPGVNLDRRYLKRDTSYTIDPISHKNAIERIVPGAYPHNYIDLRGLGISADQIALRSITPTESSEDTDTPRHERISIDANAPLVIKIHQHVYKDKENNNRIDRNVRVVSIMTIDPETNKRYEATGFWGGYGANATDSDTSSISDVSAHLAEHPAQQWLTIDTNKFGESQRDIAATIYDGNIWTITQPEYDETTPEEDRTQIELIDPLDMTGPKTAINVTDRFEIVGRRTHTMSLGSFGVVTKFLEVRKVGETKVYLIPDPAAIDEKYSDTLRLASTKHAGSARYDAFDWAPWGRRARHATGDALGTARETSKNAVVSATKTVRDGAVDLFTHGWKVYRGDDVARSPLHNHRLASPIFQESNYHVVFLPSPTEGTHVNVYNTDNDDITGLAPGTPVKIFLQTPRDGDHEDKRLRIVYRDEDQQSSSGWIDIDIAKQVIGTSIPTEELLRTRQLASFALDRVQRTRPDALNHNDDATSNDLSETITGPFMITNIDNTNNVLTLEYNDTTYTMNLNDYSRTGRDLTEVDISDIFDQAPRVINNTLTSRIDKGIDSVGKDLREGTGRGISNAWNSSVEWTKELLDKEFKDYAGDQIPPSPLRREIRSLGKGEHTYHLAIATTSPPIIIPKTRRGEEEETRKTIPEGTAVKIHLRTPREGDFVDTHLLVEYRASGGNIVRGLIALDDANSIIAGSIADQRTNRLLAAHKIDNVSMSWPDKLRAKEGATTAEDTKNRLQGKNLRLVSINDDHTIGVKITGGASSITHTIDLNDYQFNNSALTIADRPINEIFDIRTPNGRLLSTHVDRGNDAWWSWALRGTSDALVAGGDAVGQWYTNDGVSRVIGAGFNLIGDIAIPTVAGASTIASNLVTTTIGTLSSSLGTAVTTATFGQKQEVLNNSLEGQKFAFEPITPESAKEYNIWYRSLYVPSSIFGNDLIAFEATPVTSIPEVEDDDAAEATEGTTTPTYSLRVPDDFAGSSILGGQQLRPTRLLRNTSDNSVSHVEVVKPDGTKLIVPREALSPGLVAKTTDRRIGSDHDITVTIDRPSFGLPDLPGDGRVTTGIVAGLQGGRAAGAILGGGGIATAAGIILIGAAGHHYGKNVDDFLKGTQRPVFDGINANAIQATLTLRDQAGKKADITRTSSLGADSVSFRFDNNEPGHSGLASATGRPNDTTYNASITLQYNYGTGENANVGAFTIDLGAIVVGNGPEPIGGREAGGVGGSNQMVR